MKADILHRYIVRFGASRSEEVSEANSGKGKYLQRRREQEEHVKAVETWVDGESLNEEVKNVSGSAFDVVFVEARSTVGKRLSEVPGVIEVVEDSEMEFVS